MKAPGTLNDRREKVALPLSSLNRPCRFEATLRASTPSPRVSSCLDMPRARSLSVLNFCCTSALLNSAVFQPASRRTSPGGRAGDGGGAGVVPLPRGEVALRSDQTGWLGVRHRGGKR